MCGVDPPGKAANPGRMTDAPDLQPAASGRRAAGKEERRQRIIAAARDLIRETGSTGLSMRELARRAGVSLATPYNLFGSKAAVVLAVLQDVRAFRERFERVGADPLARIFAAVDMACDFYLADPAFYTTLWQAVFSAAGDVRLAIYNPKRDAFWRGLVDAAAEAGAVDAAIDRGLLLRQLDGHFRSVMLDWVVGDLPPAALAPAARHGYALILAGAASDGSRPALRTRVAAEQALLAEAGVVGTGMATLPA
jgi:AcrR family transcriptional regulator